MVQVATYVQLILVQSPDLLRLQNKILNGFIGFINNISKSIKTEIFLVDTFSVKFT